MRTFDNPRQGGAKGSTNSDMSEEWGVSFLSERARQRYMERLQARRNGQKVLQDRENRVMANESGRLQSNGGRVVIPARPSFLEGS